MLDALFAEIKGVFGKTYLFAGLLPSALLIGGWRWYREGGEGLAAALESVVASPETAASDAVLLIASALGLGLVLFAGRGFALHLLQALPGRPLRPLRDWLINRQIAQRQEIERQRQRLLWEITAVSWYERDFECPRYTTPWHETPDAAEVIAPSTEARELLERQRSAELPKRKHVATLRHGLCQLHAWARDHYDDPKCQGEIERWRRLLRDEEKRKFLKAVAEQRTREWRRVYLRAQAFPETDWIQPSALGNRRAALDEYSRKRYGINTTTLWTRLWGILAAEDRDDVTNSRLGVEVLVNIFVVLVLLALGILFLLLKSSLIALYERSPHPDWRSMGFLIGSVALAALAYGSAVFAFNGYAERVKRFVDLYRLELIRQLGYAIPGTVGEETLLFNRLDSFLSQAIPLEPSQPIAFGEAGPSKAKAGRRDWRRPG